MSKIQISGWGCVSAIGNNEQETMANFFSEKLELTTEQFPEGFVFKANLAKHPSESRISQLMQIALKEALETACLNQRELNRSRVGVCFGSTSAINFSNEKFLIEFFKHQSPPLKEDDHFFRASLARKIKDALQLSGPDLTINNACTSGADAMGIAKLWLDSDLCDIVIAGGIDVTPSHILKGFDSLQLCSPTLAKPFDKNRCGLNLGEGAGIVIMETPDCARRRQARARGFLLGYGSASDFFHPTSPDPDGTGIKSAITQALAGLPKDQLKLAFINAHGTATPTNDLTEGRVFKSLFANVPILSTKGYTGHTLAAAGALEAIFTLMFLKNRKLPATRGFELEDPLIGLIPTTATSSFSCNFALSTSLGFGGANAALLLEGGNDV